MRCYNSWQSSRRVPTHVTRLELVDTVEEMEHFVFCECRTYMAGTDQNCPVLRTPRPPHTPGQSPPVSGGNGPATLNQIRRYWGIDSSPVNKRPINDHSHHSHLLENPLVIGPSTLRTDLVLVKICSTYRDSPGPAPPYPAVRATGY
jgi:hypothetical protein